MGATPPAVVMAAPAVPPRVGLLPSIGQTAEAERWEGGFGWAPENCGASGAGNPCGSLTKDIPENEDVLSVEPFFVWAGDKCAPFQVRDYEARARRQLAASESYQVAHELWTGTLAKAEVDAFGNPWVNKYLASPAGDVVTSGPDSPTDVLACIELALGDCLHGARGMIHATRQLVTYWNQLGHLRRDGNVILTIHDTIVVPDAGYDGSGPDGQPANDGSQWAYGTDMVQVRLSPVTVVPANPETFRESLDRETNLVEVRAERLAAASFGPCCLIQAEVDQSLCGIGGS